MMVRRAIAVLALIGAFVATYLHLYKLGKIGTLACGSGGCEIVQFSPQSVFWGVGVAFIGVVGYAGLFLLGIVATLPALADRKWPMQAIALASGVGVLFTLYLTYLELFVIHAICRWCVTSAAIITAIFILSLVDLRRSSVRPA
jgi:uncharacterized membrane protein